MKIFKRYITYAVAAFVALGSTSCIQEELTECQPITDSSGDFYFTLKIKVPKTTSTKAGEKPAWDEFADGTIEHVIGSSGNWVLFFDTEGKLKETASLSDRRTEVDEKQDNIEYWFRTPLQSVTEAEYQELAVGKGEKDVIGYCLVILNGSPVAGSLNLTEGISYGDVIENVIKANDPRTIGWTETTGSDETKTRYFTMTNSAYKVGEGIQVATPYTLGAIQKLTDKNEYDWKNAITVYVERMVSKASLDVLKNSEDGEFSQKGQTQDGSYLFTPTQDNKLKVCVEWKYSEASRDYEPVIEEREWQAEITGWNMNALERQEYIFKKVNKNGYGFLTDWNGSANYRAYWAEDPDYGKYDYPWQYRKAVNLPNGVTEIPDYEKNYSDKENKNILFNYSYDKLNIPFGRDEYFPEHTFDNDKNNVNLTQDKFDQRRNLLAGTHLIVTGKLNIKGGADVESDDQYKTIDLYRDGAGICYKSARECLWSLVKNFNDALTYQEEIPFKYYNWSDQSNGTQLYAKPSDEKNGGFYRLYYKDKLLTYDRIMNPENVDKLSNDDVKELLVAATIKDGDGKLVLKNANLSVMNENKNHLPIYDVANGQGTPYKTTADLDFLYSLILEWCGAVDHFSEGKMYYAIPLKHKVGATDEESVYGAVRNTWYKFQIKDLKGIGIPVDDPNQPIVPNWDTEIKQERLEIILRIGICPWYEEEITIPPFGTIEDKDIEQNNENQ